MPKNTTSLDPLLPCPCCGNTDLRRGFVYDNLQRAGIWCKMCHLEISVLVADHPRRSLAVITSRWNRRVAVSSPQPLPPPATPSAPAGHPSEALAQSNWYLEASRIENGK